MIDNTKIKSYYEYLCNEAKSAYKFFTDDFCQVFTNLEFNVDDAISIFDIVDDIYEDDLYAINALIWKDIFIFPLVTIRFVKEDIIDEHMSEAICKDLLDKLDMVKPLCKTKLEINSFNEIYPKVLNKYHYLRTGII